MRSYRKRLLPWLTFFLLLSVLLASCFTPQPIPTILSGTAPSALQFSRLPVSGSEIPYEASLWNDGDGVQYSTNCYAYALNRRTGFPAGHKLQPGEFAGNPLRSASDVSAQRITALVLEDAQATGVFMEVSSRDSVCPEGSYKIALAVDPGVDYHWYRQNPDGTWSHKPGHTEATDRDASGNVIWDPEAADRDYGSVNYSEFGGYFCTGSP